MRAALMLLRTRRAALVSHLGRPVAALATLLVWPLVALVTLVAYPWDPVIDYMKLLFGRLWDAMYYLLTMTVDWIWQVFLDVYHKIADAMAVSVLLAISIAQRLFDVGVTIAGHAFQIFTRLPLDILTGLANMAGYAYGLFVQATQYALSLSADVFNRIAGITQWVIDHVYNPILALLQWFYDTIVHGIVEPLFGLVRGLVDQALRIAQLAWDTVVNINNFIVDHVMGAISLVERASGWLLFVVRYPYDWVMQSFRDLTGRHGRSFMDSIGEAMLANSDRVEKVWEKWLG